MTTVANAWWSKDTVAVVTGANRGIGYEIARAFAEQGLTVVVTARDQARGQAVVDTFKKDGLESVWFHQLDVASSESAQKLAAWLKQQFGGIDILVNNAGVIAGGGADGFTLSFENAKYIIGTNYYGVRNVTEALLPLLRASPAGARIVNVSSRAGLFERLKNEKVRETLRNEDNFSSELADSLATKYLEDIKAGRSAEEGWIPVTPKTNAMYGESKIILNIYAVALAKSLAKSQPEDHQILATNFCPGVTQTDMLDLAATGGFKPPPEFPLKSAAEGAETGVWLALLPKDELVGKVGKFFGEKTEYPFGWVNPPF